MTFEDPGQALEWCDTEQVKLIALIRHAAGTGHDDIAWKLAGALGSYFLVRKHLAEWLATGRISLAAVRRTGDRGGEAWVLASRGTCYCDFRQALIITPVSDKRGKAWSLHALGRPNEARQAWSDALAIFKDLGVPRAAQVQARLTALG
ncbi:hypothetical protein [Spirillospora sp. CA-294931]|uniref:hypothetical protein n=1 Tax=Spirillospora sp. CA-294931 TaxID=3240042 RepID=UPI003D8A819D